MLNEQFRNSLNTNLIKDPHSMTKNKPGRYNEDRFLFEVLMNL